MAAGDTPATPLLPGLSAPEPDVPVAATPAGGAPPWDSPS
eukprot:CAMPEP_0202882992 /NCGR_PEP_ID=MMETSP1391-20130828/38776_1 /ASSEMBLY_ACC=CAM_ASM_000867 /TAXON_ID=1034604 /ORGANISM="Chlamydomonas leiostraca, Strain SAG 11-49" /LENGTH=39 /DNA_ID= /DNA_START= /DNA_END= /DNA_ORIENTATION=